MFTSNNNNDSEIIINEDFQMEDLKCFGVHGSNTINNELFEPFSLFGNENTNEKPSQKFSSESLNDDEFFLNRKKIREGNEMLLDKKVDEFKKTELKEIKEQIKQKSIKKELNSKPTSFKPINFSCIFPKKETINKDKPKNENEKTKISKKNEMSQKTFHLNFNLNSKISQKTETNDTFKFLSKPCANIEKPQNETNKVNEQISNKNMNENPIDAQQNSSKFSFTLPNFKNTNQKEATPANSFNLINSFSTKSNANISEKENDKNNISKNECKISNFIFNKPPLATPCKLNLATNSLNKTFVPAIAIASSASSKQNTFNFALKTKPDEKIIKKEENKEWSNISNLFQQVRNFIQEEEENDDNVDSLSEKQSFISNNNQSSQKTSQFSPIINGNENEISLKNLKEINDPDEIIHKQEDKIKFEDIIMFNQTNMVDKVNDEEKQIIIEKSEPNLEINPYDLFKHTSKKSSFTKKNSNHELNENINKVAEEYIPIKKENKNDNFLSSLEKELCNLQNEIFSSQLRKSTLSFDIKVLEQNFFDISFEISEIFSKYSLNLEDDIELRNSLESL